MHKNQDIPQGKVVTLWVESEQLKGSLMGDPVKRRVDVYIPAGLDGRGLPLLVDLTGFMSGGPHHTNWRGWGENVPERADRLIAGKLMPPAVIAFPDCYSRLGGNQYVDSVATGLWDSFLIKEMLPAVEQAFGCGGSGKRGIFGKSSGGYGALTHAMLHGGDIWNAVASHSGDVGFELMYRTDFCTVLRRLSDFDLSVEKFINHCETAQKLKDYDWHTLMVLAQAASYDPDPSHYLGIRLPVDLYSCTIIPERWNNWLAADPLYRVEREDSLSHLKKLSCFYFDCGTLDQYNLLYGSRLLHQKLENSGVQHIYEEFPDTHSSVDYRMDISLPLLAAALT